MRGANASQQRIADLQRRVSDLESEAVTLRAENDALRFRPPEVTTESARRIVHDLNNLLQSIMGKAELVLDDASVSGQTRNLWQTIFDAAVHSAGLTRQLLALGKSEIISELPVASARSPIVTRRDERRSMRAILPGRILVAEDQRAVQDLVRTVLTNAGHKVTVVANGAEAVAAIQEADFDLVLMDMRMPVMDGLSAARKIRQIVGPRSKVPIIAASGTEFTDNTESLVEAGINDCISKPFILATLLEKIGSWLDRSVNQVGAEVDARRKTEGMSLVELDSLMGRAWVERGLTSLIEQIDELFSAHQATIPRDRAQLVTRAHALVSLAGLLGFSDLARRCSALEEAASRERDIVGPLTSLKAVAAQARTKAAEMLNGH